jgi:mannose-6-phosphate isomerase-like protein (cupin superfamily)
MSGPTTSFPSASAYASAPVQFPQLRVLDLLSEAHASPDTYRNIVINQVNDHCLRLSTLQGEYPWHLHPGTDELFLVLEGHLLIDFPERPTLRLNPGQMVTVPAGMVHRTRSETPVVSLCFEQLHADTEFVPPPDEWVAQTHRTGVGAG